VYAVIEKRSGLIFSRLKRRSAAGKINDKGYQLGLKASIQYLEMPVSR
jgi:hypothetical protein